MLAAIAISGVMGSCSGAFNFSDAGNEAELPAPRMQAQAQPRCGAGASPVFKSGANACQGSSTQFLRAG